MTVGISGPGGSIPFRPVPAGPIVKTTRRYVQPITDLFKTLVVVSDASNP